MTKETLIFSKDKSEILRGIAVTFMVVNHSMPGKVIAFAVPLFTFMVGYGYAFARNKTLLHGARRVWHLLANFWIVLLGICLPIALFIAPQKVIMSDLLMNMIGLNPNLNFFCWYISFYIFAMLLMPFVSKLLDRYKLVAFLLLSAISIALYYIISGSPYIKIFPWGMLARDFCYFPLVLSGYWFSKEKIFEKIKYPGNGLMAAVAIAAMVGLYFLRGIPYIKNLDIIWAPLFAGLVSIFFTICKWKPLTVLFTQLGKESMHIWFLHALFFTHATKGLFYPLVSWTKIMAIRIVIILAISYLMALAVDWIYKKLCYLASFVKMPPARFSLPFRK